MIVAALWFIAVALHAAAVDVIPANLQTFCSAGKEQSVSFEKGFRLTCRCGEEVNGRKLHDPPDTEYTTYAWVYQW